MSIPDRPPAAHGCPRPGSLSVCIAGQDMAHRIRPLLDQASAVADEIVYVDGGSKDDSEAVVSRYPKARFVKRPFDGSIARQKNFALDCAKGEWALILDTDELMGPCLLALLPELLRSRAKSVKMPRYWLVDKRHYVRGEGIYPDRQLRLFRNRPEMRYLDDHPIHHVLPRDGRRDPCLRLKRTHILHYCLMWQDRKTREKKAARYARIHPSAAGANRFYLYEDIPHRIAPCREFWVDGRQGDACSLTHLIVDRLRLWSINRHR